MNDVRHCLVLGAGVSGLSSAIRLLQAGHRVEVQARGRVTATTSSIAAAIWYPYRAAPLDKVTAWGAVTYAELERLANVPDTGVTMCEGIEVIDLPADDPLWAQTVPGFRRAAASELPEGFAHGYHLRVPVADMTRYLGWLESWVLDLGGSIASRTVGSLDDVLGEADVIINCTGLGAREVAQDASVYGVLGQVQVVRAPDVRSFVIYDTVRNGVPETTYIIPRSSSVVLGGTAVENVDDVTVNPETAAAIRTRCIHMNPALRGAPIVADKVGIRPCRPEVRLEAEQRGAQRIIHNYGHGGAGVTLSWGCAEAVAKLV